MKQEGVKTVSLNSYSLPDWVKKKILDADDGRRVVRVQLTGTIWAQINEEEDDDDGVGYGMTISLWSTTGIPVDPTLL